jgi:hypothetical protein
MRGRGAALSRGGWANVPGSEGGVCGLVRGRGWHQHQQLKMGSVKGPEKKSLCFCKRGYVMDLVRGVIGVESTPEDAKITPTLLQCCD